MLILRRDNKTNSLQQYNLKTMVTGFQNQFDKSTRKWFEKQNRLIAYKLKNN